MGSRGLVRKHLRFSLGGEPLTALRIAIYRERIQQVTIGGLRWVARETETTTTITASASGDRRRTFAG